RRPPFCSLHSAAPSCSAASRVLPLPARLAPPALLPASEAICCPPARRGYPWPCSRRQHPHRLSVNLSQYFGRLRNSPFLSGSSGELPVSRDVSRPPPVLSSAWQKLVHRSRSLRLLPALQEPPGFVASQLRESAVGTQGHSPRARLPDIRSLRWLVLT